MKLILCTDNRGGMMFLNRRPARDPAAIRDILNDTGGKRLLITPYSEKLFAELCGEYVISNDPLGEADGDDYVFIEDVSARGYLEKIDTIIVYSWDLPYPFDRKFDISPEDEGFGLVQVKDFTGQCHDTITKSVYIRKK